MATRTISDAGGNWDATGTWNEGIVPTSADEVVATATSGNVTINVAAACRSINLTGYTGTITHNANITLSIGDGTAPTSGVALLFPASGWTYTLGHAASSQIHFVGTSATVCTVDFGGKTTGTINVNAGTTTTYKLVTNGFTCGPTAVVTMTKGTFDTNGLNCSWGKLGSGSANGQAIILGSSVITLTATTGEVLEAANLTVTPGSSTIIISDTGTGNKTVHSRGKTYNNLSIVGGGAGFVSFQSGGTWNEFKINAPKTVRFVAGTTQTITSFIAIGTSGNVISLISVTAGSAATLSTTNKDVISDYLSIQDLTAAGAGARWYAGSHSTNVSGNTGWIFGDPSLERIGAVAI